MNKKELRAQTIQALITAEHQSARLYEALFATEQWRRAQSIAVTLSTPIELDTQVIIDAAQKAGKRVMVPRTLPEFQMEFVELTAETVLAKTKFGILEPKNGAGVAKASLDFIIVPGLLFATATHDRLGFGGGFYDRYLADYPGATASLALPAQRVEQPTWAVNDHDVKVQTIVS